MRPPGLEYYNTETEREKIWLHVVSFGEDFNEDRVVVMETDYYVLSKLGNYSK